MHAAFQLFIKLISKEHSNKVIIRNIKKKYQLYDTTLIIKVCISVLT